MYLFEAYTHNPFIRMKPGIQLLNIFLFVLIETVLFFASGKLSVALRIMCAFFSVLGLAEYYLVEFRGVTLLPWDIGSLGTAAEVASGYNYVPGTRAVLCIAGFVILFIICGIPKLSLKDVCSGLSKGCGILIRTSGVLFSIIFIAGYTLFVQTDYAVRTFGFYNKLFTPTAISERDGTLTAFLMELQYVNVKKPKGYSKEAAGSILASYEGEKPSEKPANIIVIMNEAFSDLAVLGDFKTDVDYMPYVHSLLSNEADTDPDIYHEAGYLNVSIVGGNTPNTEFEFLTGNSLLFLPEGSIPYQQYVKEGIYAMPSYLSGIGYHTVGMHPYYSRGWERERVYKDLGFEKSVFIEGFSPDDEKIRNYVSDMACSDEIIKEYEKNRESGSPLFVFLVTMQNHSPYDKDFGSLPVDVNITDSDGSKSVKTCERYLSLIKRSDEAFRYLTEYFENEEEDTVIVMFGDHEPSDSVVRPILSRAGKDTRNLSEEDVAKRYIVPYVIWSNFKPEASEGSVRDTSANFLGNRVLELSKAGSYPYREFLKEIEKTYPTVSAVRVVDDEGNELTDKEISEDSLIERYRVVQYHELFDNEE